MKLAHCVRDSRLVAKLKISLQGPNFKKKQEQNVNIHEISNVNDKISHRGADNK
jgi:hypothetical protein